ncbi:MAG: sigma-70 family RNA polymerase sigma factor [Saprospiraceae bacterium]|nr:sigma-70 family RNA polymerase sigma factor [Saprospiraceae bacterium]
MNTQESLDLIRNGDRAFFHSLYYSMEESCRKYIFKRGGDETMIDEILHEGLYRFFVRVKEKQDFQITSSLEAVVFGFIKMVWQQKCRTDSRYRKMHTDIDEDDWVRESLTEENTTDADTSMIMSLMDNLGKDCKEVLIAFYVHKNSLQEIADELNFSYDYAKLKRFRCIADLRKKYLQMAS